MAPAKALGFLGLGFGVSVGFLGVGVGLSWVLGRKRLEFGLRWAARYDLGFGGLGLGLELGV